MSNYYSLEVLRAERVIYDNQYFHSKTPNLYIKALIDDDVKETRAIRKASPTWNETLMFPYLEATMVLKIELYHKSSLLPDLCIGYNDVGLIELLQKCVGGKEFQLTLRPPADQSATSKAGVVFLRLAVNDEMSSVRHALSSAQKDVEQRGIMRTADRGNLVVDFFHSLGNGADAYKAVGNLCTKLDIYVEFLNEISEIHPYLNAAWKVASALYNSISMQFKCDKKAVDLLRTMEDAFSFVHDTQSLRNKSSNLEQTIIKLLKQVIECCLFLRQYARHGFTGRMLTSGNNQKIDEFAKSFVDLKSAIDSGLILNTTILVAQMYQWVEALHLKDKLDPRQLNAFDRPRCLPGTRVKIRNQIIGWFFSGTIQNTLWLYGVAGSGKSTVTMTIAKDLQDMSRLGCFLFFVRGKSQPDSLIRTIAYNLASFDSSIAPFFLSAIERNRNIALAPAEDQFEKLLLRPLISAAPSVQGPIVIILDALDECGTPRDRQRLMQLFRDKLWEVPPKFRFLITSRREPDIDKALSTQPLFVRAIELDYTSAASRADVHRYLRHDMYQVVNAVPPEWPWDTTMEVLDRAADGLFIWASTAVKMVSASDDPFRKLEELVADSRRLVRLGLTDLYSAVLRSSGINWDDEISRTRFSQVFSLILACEVPLTDTFIDLVLEFPPERSSSLILSKLQCLLSYSPDAPIRLFHTSFYDYLTSPDRSSDPWHTELPSLERPLVPVMWCFETMKMELRFNICDLGTSYEPNTRIPGLQDRIKMNITSKLAYACRAWAHHLREASFTPTLLEELIDFLHKRLLFWLEVLSLTGKLDVAGPLLDATRSWTAEHDTLTSASLESVRVLVDSFMLSISKSTPHIYVSMLSFMSDGTEISDHLKKHSSSIVRVDRRGARKESAEFETFEGHTSWVVSVGFSPDGSRIVSGSHDKTIRVWDAKNGELVSGSFEGHTDWVQSIAFSPDGRRIVSGSRDRTIRVWDAENGQLISGPFEGHTGPVNSVGFSPDGNRIVSDTIRVWNAENGQLVSGPFEGHTVGVWPVAFSPDGNRIVSGSLDWTIRVWDAESGQPVSGPFEGHTGWVLSVAFSPDGKRIVSGSYDETIRVWDAENGQLVSGPFEGHTGWVLSVAFSPDGTRIVSGSLDWTIRVWDAESGQPVSGPFEGHTGWVLSVAFSPDGKRIVSGSYDETIRVWDAENGQLVSGPFEGHTGWVLSVAFSPDGTRIVSGSRDMTIRVWDAENGQLVSGPFEGHTGLVRSVAFSPDGNRIVSGSADKTIRVWDAENGRNARQTTGKTSSSMSTIGPSAPNVAFTNWTLAEDGWILGEEGELLLWVPEDFRPTLWRPQNTAVFNCKFSTRLDFTNAALGERWQECFTPPT